MNQEEAELLDRYAFRAASSGAVSSGFHASRIGQVVAGSWQAERLKQAGGVAIARNPQELRDALADSDTVAVFLPLDAFMTPEVLERACAESSFSKLIVVETASGRRAV